MHHQCDPFVNLFGCTHLVAVGGDEEHLELVQIVDQRVGFEQLDEVVHVFFRCDVSDEAARVG